MHCGNHDASGTAFDWSDAYLGSRSVMRDMRYDDPAQSDQLLDPVVRCATKYYPTIGGIRDAMSDQVWGDSRETRLP